MYFVIELTLLYFDCLFEIWPPFMHTPITVGSPTIQRRPTPFRSGRKNAGSLLLVRVEDPDSMAADNDTPAKGLTPASPQVNANLICTTRHGVLDGIS
jgi:hypothetical protein